LLNFNLGLHSFENCVSKGHTAMGNTLDDKSSVSREVTGLSEGCFIVGTAEEQANFIRAVTVGLNDLAVWP
jgi:hypothetical protein